MSSISIGMALRDALMTDERVASLATACFPVGADDATLPYITYYCGEMVEAATKDCRGYDRLRMFVECYSADYDSGVELAEAVREALRNPGRGMRGCFLADRKELRASGAFCQQMVFEIRN